MRLLIVGPQGAGKGTQAELLAEAVGVPHISTGDIFRNLNASTETGRQAKHYMETGALVPDELTQQLLADRLAEPDTSPGFLLDGFPRNTPQAQWLATLLQGREQAIDFVILLSAPDDVLIDRMAARGRADDTTEAIGRRLAIYHEETKPLIGFYGDLVRHVDGVGTVDEVHRRVVDAIAGAGRTPAPHG